MGSGDPAPEELEQTQEWRERLSLRLVRGFAVVFALAGFLMVGTLEGRAKPVLVVVAFGGCFVLAIPALTGWPSGRARTWCLIVPCLVASAASLALNGFLSAPGVILALTLMLSGVLLGRRTMWALGCCVVAGIVLIAWSMVTGRLALPPEPNTSLRSAAVWLRTMGVSILATGLFGSLVVAVIDRMERGLSLARSEAARREVAERERAEALRLETVGRLAAGVAHDFNNILTAILGCAELLEGQLSADPHKQMLSRTIVESSRRAAQLTGQLLVYSRQAQLVIEPVDVHASIRRATNLLSRSTDPGLELVSSLAAEGHVVEADAAQLESALLNLLVNARDAMPAGGRLVVRTTSDEASIFIEIEDTGSGIADDALPRIFDPFFTTKPLGQGTGLGLAAVSGTVESLGGNVTVQTKLGKGTVFRIGLPLSRRSPTAFAAANEFESGSGILLLVDDQAPVLRAASLALQALGYEVVAVSSGAEAIGEVERAPDRFDLVLLDLRMPQLGGEATFDALIRINPELRVLVWSGYGAQEDLPEMLRRGAVGFLPKPYGVAELSQAVARAKRRQRPPQG
ncbi:MAG TPA: ATP-binding protein [Polyangiaceae bacterium]|nr:ATP-binding protein [Polyangiaceae bacterium]